MSTIGFLKEDYNWRRNITRHNHAGFSFRKVHCASTLAHRALRKLGRNSKFLENTLIPPAAPSVDLLHVWRTVCYGSRHWIVSTSVGLPFGWKRESYRRALELLASGACRRILVNSQYAKEWQRRKAEMSPRHADAVMSKTEVLPTPQDLVVERWSDKGLPADQIVLTLVGHHFFRKGGAETVRVVDRLIREGAPLQLNIVSRLGLDPHSGATERDVARSREMSVGVPTRRSSG